MILVTSVISAAVNSSFFFFSLSIFKESVSKNAKLRLKRAVVPILKTHLLTAFNDKIVSVSFCRNYFSSVLAGKEIERGVLHWFPTKISFFMVNLFE
jgi:hypothetical protein